MKVNQRDLNSIVNDLLNDNVQRRYVARIIFVNRLETYLSLISLLSDEADVVVNLSDYCAGEDSYPDIKKLIAQGAHDLEIEECAVGNGMVTLHKSCLEHVKKGLTTIEEFVRVLGMADE